MLDPVSFLKISHPSLCSTSHYEDVTALLEEDVYARVGVWGSSHLY